jgi:hypothetical protein
MQGKTAYIRPKVAGPFPISFASGSYVYRTALFLVGKKLQFVGTVCFRLAWVLQFLVNFMLQPSIHDEN